MIKERTGKKHERTRRTESITEDADINEWPLDGIKSVISLKGMKFLNIFKIDTDYPAHRQEKVNLSNKLCSTFSLHIKENIYMKTK